MNTHSLTTYSIELNDITKQNAISLKMNTRSLTTYSIIELNDIAKQNAISNIRSSNSYMDFDWYSCIIEDFKQNNEFFNVDNVYFRGFCSQGDGAMFEYSEIKQKLIEKFIETLNIPNWKKNLIRYANVIGKGKHKGHYYHEYSVEHSIDYIENNLYSVAPNVAEFLDNIFPDIEEFIREEYIDMAKNLYRVLNAEYDYLMEDEQIIDYCEVNEFEFTINGNLFKCFT